MPRNSLAVIDWPTVGPRALAWLKAEAPRRSSAKGLAEACATALGVPKLTGPRLTDWLGEATRRQAWYAIKGTVGRAYSEHRGVLPGAPLASAGATATPRPLTDFLIAKKQSACPVCQLPEEIKAQLASASAKGIKVADRLEWLTAECGARVTRSELESHGRHLA